MSCLSTQGIHFWSQKWQKMLGSWSISALNEHIAEIADFDDVKDSFLVFACFDKLIYARCHSELTEAYLI